MMLLQASGISKRFGTVQALHNAQLEVRAGEIHAVMGENGAGKSTLMKILSGVYTADSGEILFEGQHITPANPRDALARGIAIVHQELSVVPPLTVAENIFPGRLPQNALGFVRYQQLYADARAVLRQLDVDIDPRTPLEQLSIANQQLVEIAKTLTLQCKLIILDEPTSALTEREAETLFGLLRKLAADGVGILYISHKLSEVLALCDRITVLRDGQYINTVNIQDVTADDIVRMMVGRDIGDFYPPKSSGRGAPLLEVRGLQLREGAPLNNFTLHRGEVLGFAGLIGSGRSELMRAVFGADGHTRGEVLLDGAPLKIHRPTDAIRAGIGYLPEDRKAAGLFLDMAIRANVEAANIEQVSRAGFVLPQKERALARSYVEQLNVSAASVDQEVRRLSGGNQQKVLLAKWLAIKPRVLIVDEPTRGIDVGAKREIHYLLRALAESGVGVVMVSSELPEILGMSDRVHVMYHGAIVGDIASQNATEERIMQYASGQAV